MKAVIMCGGTGSRLRPLTENRPKPIIKLLNVPVLEIIIKKLISSGIRDIYLSLGYMANDIIEFCENRNFDADIHYCEESKPLGTAGGVKNCIHNSDDEILVLSSDNIFDFNINSVYDFHQENEADFTVVAIEASDPREYGTIVTDDDNSIVSFIEKPTWEQAYSAVVNTGMYIMNGEILDKIPEDTFFDFSENLFPMLFADNRRFMCCQTDGYWGDVGEFDAYLGVTHDILDGLYTEINPVGTMYTSDTQDKDGNNICAPCFIGENVKLGKECTVGSYSVLGNNCEIGDGAVIDGSVIWNDTVIMPHSEIKNAIIADNCTLKENTAVDDMAVIGSGTVIGRFSRVLGGCKIWPGRRIAPESAVSRDIFFESPESIEFDIFGISGKIFSQFTLPDAARLGQAVASIKNIERIGVGCDEKTCSSVYKNICASGIQSCGVICYDFEEVFKAQAYFYSSYCSLDAFIYISTAGDIINFSFFGKNGVPFSSRTARLINNNYKYSSFMYCDADKCVDIFRMSLLSTVYKSAIQKMITENLSDTGVKIECENHILKSLVEDILEKNSVASDANSVQFLINENGTSMYAIENGIFYSSARILAVLCELEFAGGRDVILSEDAPSFIEETAGKYGRTVHRVYESASVINDFDETVFTDNIWTFDAVFMIFRLLNIMAGSKMTLNEICESRNDFILRKNILEFQGEPSQIRKNLENSEAVKNGRNEVYYCFENRKGRARVRQLGNANKVRILVEAADMETAKEISADVTAKITRGDIDNINKK